MDCPAKTARTQARNIHVEKRFTAAKIEKEKPWRIYSRKQILMRNV
jgi:hypothetical protein